jgi:crotonobetainyl-CoA:carnitine CoA-transferase CaiB-like acyl-CoA transferase
VEIEKCLASRTAAEWVSRLTEFGVPAGPVLNVEECFANEQVRTLPMVWEVEHPVLGKERILGPGIQMERTPPRICSAAPEHGEHTDEVLTELGYSDDQIARFHAEGVV